MLFLHDMYEVVFPLICYSGWAATPGDGAAALAGDGLIPRRWRGR